MPQSEDQMLDYKDINPSMRVRFLCLIAKVAEWILRSSVVEVRAEFQQSGNEHIVKAITYMVDGITINPFSKSPISAPIPTKLKLVLILNRIACFVAGDLEVGTAIEAGPDGDSIIVDRMKVTVDEFDVCEYVSAIFVEAERLCES